MNYGLPQWIEDLLERQVPDLGIFHVGEGWRPLIEYAYDITLSEKGFVVCQVKEKMGGLRFYISRNWDYYENLSEEEREKFNNRFEHIGNQLWALENVSHRICEECGAHGKPRRGGWIKTLCEKHNKERNDKHSS